MIESQAPTAITSARQEGGSASHSVLGAKADASRPSFPWRRLLVIPVYAFAVISLLVSLSFVGMRLIGIEPLVDRTSSMEPTIMAGDLLLSRAISGPLELGRIYVHNSPETGGDTAHRLDSVGPRPGTWYTKGDNNTIRDAYLLSTDDFSSEVIGWLPRMGYVNNALAQPLPRLLMFLAPLGLFIPSLLKGIRRRSDASGEPDAVATADSDTLARPTAPQGLQLSRADMVISALVGLAIFALLSLRLFLSLSPVLIPTTTSESPLDSGAIGMLRPTATHDLQPGDVVYLTMPDQDVPNLRLVTPPDPAATLAPASPGNTYVFTVDATDPTSDPAVPAQLDVDASVPRVVGAVPRLGSLMPIIATPTGFAGLVAALGLFATLLFMRLAMATPRERQRSEKYHRGASSRLGVARRDGMVGADAGEA